MIILSTSCAVQKMLAKVDAEAAWIGLEHHLLQIAGHQGYGVEKAVVAVYASTHWLSLL